MSENKKEITKALQFQDISPSFIYTTGLCLITAFAAVLRISRLSEGYLWFDERFTSHIVSLGYRDLFHTIYRDVHPPLYFLLLKLWAYFFGSGANSLRGFSLVVGTGCVPVAGYFAKRIFGWKTALCVMISIAVSPGLIHYSHEARMYSLINFLSIIQTFMLCFLIQSDKRASVWIVWGIISLCCVQIHHLYIIAGTAQCIILFYLIISETIKYRKDREHSFSIRIHSLYAIGIWFIIGILYIIPLLNQLQRSGQRLQWMPVPGWVDLIYGMSQPYLWGGGYPLKTFFHIILSTGIILTAVYGTALERKTERTVGLYLMFIYFTFLSMTFMISQGIVRCYFVERYPVLVLPFLTIAITAGLCRIKPYAIGAILLFILWGINLTSIKANCLHPERPRMEPLVNAVRKNNPLLQFILYDSGKNLNFHKMYFSDKKFISMNSLREGKAEIPASGITYIQDSTIWPENPDLNMFNPLLLKRCSRKIQTLITVDPYYVYIIEGLDIPQFGSEWKDRLYIGRKETLGREWTGFIGAEDASLNDDPSFMLFHFNHEAGISYRWTQREQATYQFVNTPPLPSGQKKMHICLSVDPGIFPQSTALRFEVHADGSMIEHGSLLATGIRKEYIIPFHLLSDARTVTLKTIFPTREAPSLSSRYGDVPIVGYLFFWAGLTEEKE